MQKLIFVREQIPVPLSVFDYRLISITVARFFEGVPALLRLDEPFATSTKR